LSHDRFRSGSSCCALAMGVLRCRPVPRSATRSPVRGLPQPEVRARERTRLLVRRLGALAARRLVTGEEPQQMFGELGRRSAAAVRRVVLGTRAAVAPRRSSRTRCGDLRRRDRLDCEGYESCATRQRAASVARSTRRWWSSSESPTRLCSAPCPPGRGRGLQYRHPSSRESWPSARPPLAHPLALAERDTATATSSAMSRSPDSENDQRNATRRDERSRQEPAGDADAPKARSGRDCPKRSEWASADPTPAD